MKVEITRRVGDNRIDLKCDVHYSLLYRFSGSDHPPGRPWHLVGCGWFFESPEACIEFLTTPRPRPQPSVESSGITYTGYGANSHAPCGN